MSFILMKSYLADNVFRGYTKNILVNSGNRKYYVPIAVYQNSLLHPPNHIEEFGHRIETDIEPNNSENVENIIYFMHCAALHKYIKPQNYNPLNVNNIQKLVSMLAVIGWCDTMIKPSESYNNYKKCAQQSILQMVMIIRSIVCSDDTWVCGTESRLKFLKLSELPIVIPEYLDNWVLIPAPPSKNESEPNCWKSDFRKNLIQYGEEKFPWDGARCKPDFTTYRLYCSGWISSSTCKKVENMQSQLLNDFISREMRIMCYEHPNYLKIEGFNDACISIVCSLITNEDIKLHCISKPKMNICHVFKYGLAHALAADYE